MSNYIDGFIFPLKQKHIQAYQQVAQQVAEIWKEYGAISYHEYIGDDMHLEGTRSFTEMLKNKEDEIAVFGWVVFPSKAVRDDANKQVPLDQRMHDLVGPLCNPEDLVFDARRMVYGGFKSFIDTVKE